MKSFIVFAMLVAAAVAAAISSGPEADAKVLRNDLDNIGLEGFSNEYETSNGIQAQSQGVLKNAGTENEALEVRGFYAYPGPDGVLYRVDYLANENGFQPSAPHLPVGPSAQA